MYGQPWLFFEMRKLRVIKAPTHPMKPKKGEEATAAEAQAGLVLVAVESPGDSDDKIEICGKLYAPQRRSTVTEHSRYLRQDPPQDQRTPQEAWRDTRAIPARHCRLIQACAAQNPVYTALGLSQLEGRTSW